MSSASADVADSSTITTRMCPSFDITPASRTASARFSANRRARTCILTVRLLDRRLLSPRTLLTPSPRGTLSPRTLLSPSPRGTTLRCALALAHASLLPAAPPTNAPAGTRSRSPPASTSAHSRAALSSTLPPVFMEYVARRCLISSAPRLSATSSASKHSSTRSPTSTTAEYSSRRLASARSASKFLGGLGRPTTMTSARSRTAARTTASISSPGGVAGTTATGFGDVPPTLTAMPARLVP
mmetsp:Transcript_3000/g.11785  ORF Transcript_3000/g.11785 Transcript_3000/m.11785 type:complete len:242 (-) Transcript_3000:293-1018(-)